MKPIPNAKGERPSNGTPAAETVQSKAAREAERKARSEEMRRRFNADLEELGCEWVYQEIRNNGQQVQAQLVFVAK